MKLTLFIHTSVSQVTLRRCPSFTQLQIVNFCELPPSRDHAVYLPTWSESECLWQCNRLVNTLSPGKPRTEKS